MTDLHLRLASVDDAAAIAQLAFDVMEQNPLNTSYTTKSEWSPNMKRSREIGCDDKLYDVFLHAEQASWRHDLERMRETGDMICVVYDAEAANEIVGCLAMSADMESAALRVDRIFALRDARETGKFMLDVAKSQAAQSKLATVTARAPFGVHRFFAENGFKTAGTYVKPFDNPMVFDMMCQNARLADTPKSTRIFPQSTSIPVVNPKAE